MWNGVWKNPQHGFYANAVPLSPKSNNNNNNNNNNNSSNNTAASSSTSSTLSSYLSMFSSSNTTTTPEPTSPLLSPPPPPPSSSSSPSSPTTITTMNAKTSVTKSNKQNNNNNSSSSSRNKTDHAQSSSSSLLSIKTDRNHDDSTTTNTQNNVLMIIDPNERNKQLSPLSSSTMTQQTTIVPTLVSSSSSVSSPFFVPLSPHTTFYRAKKRSAQSSLNHNRIQNQSSSIPHNMNNTSSTTTMTASFSTNNNSSNNNHSSNKREWGIFMLENTSHDKYVHFGMRGLHIKWHKQYKPTIIPIRKQQQQQQQQSTTTNTNTNTNTSNNKYRQNNSNNNNNNNSSSNNNDDMICSNIVRLQLKPNSFCIGYYPLKHPNSQLLFVIELHDYSHHYQRMRHNNTTSNSNMKMNTRTTTDDDDGDGDDDDVIHLSSSLSSMTNSMFIPSFLQVYNNNNNNKNGHHHHHHNQNDLLSNNKKNTSHNSNNSNNSNSSSNHKTNNNNNNILDDNIKMHPPTQTAIDDVFGDDSEDDDDSDDDGDDHKNNHNHNVNNDDDDDEQHKRNESHYMTNEHVVNHHHHHHNSEKRRHSATASSSTSIIHSRLMYFIDHQNKYDIILSCKAIAQSNSTTHNHSNDQSSHLPFYSLFSLPSYLSLSSSSTTTTTMNNDKLMIGSPLYSMSVEPITYRFFSDYRPLSMHNAPLLYLNHNMSYDKMNRIDFHHLNNNNNNNNNSSSSSSNTNSSYLSSLLSSNTVVGMSGGIGNNSNSQPSSSSLAYKLNIYHLISCLFEDDDIDTIRNETLYHLLELSKMKDNVNLLLIIDDTNDTNDDDGNSAQSSNCDDMDHNRFECSKDVVIDYMYHTMNQSILQPMFQTSNHTHRNTNSKRNSNNKKNKDTNNIYDDDNRYDDDDSDREESYDSDDEQEEVGQEQQWEQSLLQWFKNIVEVKCCATLQNEQHGEPLCSSSIKNLLFQFSNENTDRSLELLSIRNSETVENSSGSSGSSSPVDNLDLELLCGNIDGLIILSSVQSKISPQLKSKLKILEGFPILFLFQGLERCSDIYSALREKELIEREINSIYSTSNQTSYKPFIIHETTWSSFNHGHNSAGNIPRLNAKQKSLNNSILCKFFREAIDISMERIVSRHDREDTVITIHCVDHLLESFKQQNDSKDQPRRTNSHSNMEQVLLLTNSANESDNGNQSQASEDRNIWFFGLDNERESVISAVNTLHYSLLNQLTDQVEEECDDTMLDNNKHTQTTTNLNHSDQSVDKSEEISEVIDEPKILICIRNREQFSNPKTILPTAKGSKSSSHNTAPNNRTMIRNTLVNAVNSVVAAASESGLSNPRTTSKQSSVLDMTSIPVIRRDISSLSNVVCSSPSSEMKRAKSPHHVSRKTASKVTSSTAKRLFDDTYDVSTGSDLIKSQSADSLNPKMRSPSSATSISSPSFNTNNNSVGSSSELQQRHHYQQHYQERMLNDLSRTDHGLQDTRPMSNSQSLTNFQIFNVGIADSESLFPDGYGSYRSSGSPSSPRSPATYSPLMPPPSSLLSSSTQDQQQQNSSSVELETEPSVTSENESIIIMDNNYTCNTMPTVMTTGIHKNDIVVLCVELSGRVLIAGENGIFTTFLQEVRKKTKNIVLFVDRLDRSVGEVTPSEEEPLQQNSAITMNVQPSNDAIIHLQQQIHSILYGDALDIELDKELQHSQQTNEYFRHRCYYWSKRDTKDSLTDFWYHVLK